MGYLLFFQSICKMYLNTHNHYSLLIFWIFVATHHMNFVWWHLKTLDLPKRSRNHFSLHEFSFVLLGYPYERKQLYNGHILNNFFFSWTDLIWLSRLSFLRKAALQSLHLNDFFFSWILICLTRLSFLWKAALHWVHFKWLCVVMNWTMSSPILMSSCL